MEWDIGKPIFQVHWWEFMHSNLIQQKRERQRWKKEKAINSSIEGPKLEDSLILLATGTQSQFVH